MALFNSKPGDTLSEHAWAWLGYNALTGNDPIELRRPSGWTRRFAVRATSKSRA